MVVYIYVSVYVHHVGAWYSVATMTPFQKNLEARPFKSMFHMVCVLEGSGLWQNCESVLATFLHKRRWGKELRKEGRLERRLST